jgi:micrococcal nuclease
MVRGWILVLGAALVACGGDERDPASSSTPASTVVEANATIVRVVDGDTVVADIDGHRETIRLIGIDTPETVKPDSPIECYGPEASAFTKRLLPEGTSVRLERDVEARDDYGRLLAYVYVAADGTFVNLELAAQGYAALLTFPPNIAHVDEFVAAANAAQQADLGLWRGCSG